MKFRNPHDLLGYLIRLADSDEAWRLQRGQDLLIKAEADEAIEPNERDYAELARLLWSLKADGSVAFTDWAADHQRQPRNPHAPLTYNDLVNAWEITVTSHGRIAAASSQPSVAINVASLNLNVLLSAVEEQVETMDAPEEAKNEALSKLAAARDALGGVATSATGELIATALRHVLGL